MGQTQCLTTIADGLMVQNKWSSRTSPRQRQCPPVPQSTNHQLLFPDWKYSRVRKSISTYMFTGLFSRSEAGVFVTSSYRMCLLLDSLNRMLGKKSVFLRWWPWTEHFQVGYDGKSPLLHPLRTREACLWPKAGLQTRILDFLNHTLLPQCWGVVGGF